jgi:hypothetical protein
LVNVNDEQIFHLVISNTRRKKSQQFFVTSGRRLNLVEMENILHQALIIELVGINAFGKMPENIASFLKIPIP